MERRTPCTRRPRAQDICGLAAKIPEKSSKVERRQSARNCRPKAGQVTRETARTAPSKSNFLPSHSEKSFPSNASLAAGENLEGSRETCIARGTSRILTPLATNGVIVSTTPFAALLYDINHVSLDSDHYHSQPSYNLLTRKFQTPDTNIQFP